MPSRKVCNGVYSPSLIDIREWAEYREIVTYRGRYERQPTFVPYFWLEFVMNGFAVNDYEHEESYLADLGLSEDEIDELYGSGSSCQEFFKFDVTMWNRIHFPELLDVDSVRLWIDDYGFVEHEIIEESTANNIPFVGL